MPVEIKELIIRAIVEDSQQSAHLPTDIQIGDSKRDAIVQDCVKQVLKILKRSKER